MDLVSVSVRKHAEKEFGQYPAILTDQAWSITHKNRQTTMASSGVHQVPDRMSAKSYWFACNNRKLFRRFNVLKEGDK